MFWFIFTVFLIAFSRSGESGTDCRSCFSGTCSEEFTSCRSDDVCGPMLSSWISEGCYDECEYFTTRFQEYQCYKWNGWSDDVTCQDLIGDLATCVKNCCYDESELEDCPVEETEIMTRNQMNSGMNQQVSHGHDNSHMQTQQQNTRFGRPMGTQQQGGNGNNNVRSHSRRLKQHTPVRIKKQRYYSDYPRYFQEHRSQTTTNNMNTNVNTRKRSRRLQQKSPQHMDNAANVPNHFGTQQQQQTQEHQPEPVLSRDQYTRQGQPMTTFGRRRTQHMNHMNHMQNGQHQMNTNQQRFNVKTQKRNLQEQMYNQQPRQTDLSHSQMQGENNDHHGNYNHMNVRQNNQNTLNRKLINVNDQNIQQNPMSMSDNQGFMQQQMSNPQNTGNTNSQQSHTTEGFVQQQTQQQTQQNQQNQQTQGQP